LRDFINSEAKGSKSTQKVNATKPIKSPNVFNKPDSTKNTTKKALFSEKVEKTQPSGNLFVSNFNSTKISTKPSSQNSVRTEKKINIYK
jgi:hypothetical protein